MQRVYSRLRFALPAPIIDAMPFARRKPFPWKLRTRKLALGPRTLLMAIVNLTPDSFSGDGLQTVDAACQAAGHALEHGADILDLGAESTRPGASPLGHSEELGRLLPSLEVIRRRFPESVLSVDTYHAETARAAAEAGADIINDVSGLTWDPRMADVVSATSCGLVLMHTYGRSSEWKHQPRLGGQATETVLEDLRTQLDAALRAGISRDHILLDPGLGFGKIGAENYTLLAHLDRLAELGCPLLIGLSRKSFLGGASPADRRDAGIAANTAAILAGAHVIRVHDVAAGRQAAAVADAILASDAGRP